MNLRQPSIEIYDNAPSETFTGIYHPNGSQLMRVEYKRPIGFTADWKAWEEDSEVTLNGKITGAVPKDSRSVVGP